MSDNTADGIESDPAAPGGRETDTHEKLDRSFALDSQHLRLTQVEFLDVTDRNNELVQTREYLLHPSCRELSLCGNFFLVEDLAAGRGRILIKQAPLPSARPEPIPRDLAVIPRPEQGFDFHLLQAAAVNEPLWTVLDYEGGIVERTRVLHRWQQAQRPDTPGHRLPRFLSNTWGDRSRDSRINTDFIRAEIDAAAALGADIVQIDDGWQQGSVGADQWTLYDGDTVAWTYTGFS